MKETANANQPVEEKVEQPQGWKDVNLNVSMPLDALVHFLNVLNQRLVNVEDNLTLEIDGKKMTLTEFYAQEAEKAQKEQEQQAKEN